MALTSHSRPVSHLNGCRDLRRDSSSSKHVTEGSLSSSAWGGWDSDDIGEQQVVVIDTSEV